jgi:hypothetical protein
VTKINFAPKNKHLLKRAQLNARPPLIFYLALVRSLPLDKLLLGLPHVTDFSDQEAKPILADEFQPREQRK